MATRKKRKPSNIPENESKSDRFKRVVTPRVVKAIKSINVVGYCAGVGYEYSHEQVEQICKTLHTAVDAIEGKYNSASKPAVTFGFETG